MKFWHSASNLQCSTWMHVHRMQFAAPQAGLRCRKPHEHAPAVHLPIGILKPICLVIEIGRSLDSCLRV